MCDRTFRPYAHEPPALLSPTLQEWLPVAPVAYLVSDLVDSLELTSILSCHDQPTRGTVPFHPRMLVTVPLYAFCVAPPRPGSLRASWKRTWRFGGWRRTTPPTSDRLQSFGHSIWPNSKGCCSMGSGCVARQGRGNWTMWRGMERRSKQRPPSRRR